MAAKHFLITGAARGIGRGLSRQLLAKGHRILLVDNDVAELENTAKLLAKDGKTTEEDYMTLECNLRKPEQIKQVAKKAGDMLEGQLDCLINNAACQCSVRSRRILRHC